MPGMWAWRGIGLSGGTIPLVGDLLVGVGSRFVGQPGRTWLQQGAKGSVGVGASFALQEYHNRWGLHHFGARSLQGFSLGLYQAPAESWASSPAQSWANRGVGSTVSTTRVQSKSGGSRPSSSQTDRKAPLARPRNRCRYVYRGKRCKLPRAHRGRHSYK